MKRLRYDRANDLNKLHGELLAAVPSLAPTVGADGYKYAVFQIWGNGTYVEMNVPDDADEAAIAAVVAAHVG